MELKKAGNFNESVETAKGKEWKAQRMTQLGMGIPPIRPEYRRWKTFIMPIRVDVTTLENPIVHVTPQKTPEVSTAETT